jgi:glucose-1-phosphatase
MQPKFLYFDLGKVLVDFSVERMLRQIGDVAGIAVDEVRAAVFGRDLLRQHELGRLSQREFFDSFCDATGCRADYGAFIVAAAEIFELSLPMLPLAAQLGQAGYPMGILSNTCATHWDYCVGRYSILVEGFAVHAVSFRIGAMKPQAAMFGAAAELAGVQPGEIFFVDDLAEHVAGARAAGFDAVQFTSAAALSAELRKRGVRFNY